VQCLRLIHTTNSAGNFIYTWFTPALHLLYTWYLVYRLMLMTSDIFYNDLAFMYKLKLFKVIF
jgi:hypothetical protein